VAGWSTLRGVRDGSGVDEALDELEPGQLFAGRYCIERRLGEGDRKCTYLAEDVKVGDRLVALSVVKPHAAVLDPDGTRREANLLGRVKHHNHIVAFHDYDADDPVQYLVFEYLSGGTLAELIERAAGTGELIPPDVIVRYGRQLAGALAQIHAAGVIHRDVAPHNIWLSDRQKLKLGDFDSAVLLGDQSGPRPITSEGYASPEERHGDSVDQRSDLYSLGGVLTSLALGELAFGDPTIVRERRHDLPPAFHDLLASLVAPSPDDRPASAEEVLDRLNEIRRRGTDIYAVIAKGEGPQVEFKASMRFPRGDDGLPPHLTEADRAAALRGLYATLEKMVLKTIAAFLNSQGGTLLVGVEDDGTVVGIEDDFGTFEKAKDQNVDGWQRNLKQKIINAFGPNAWAILDLKLDVTEQGTVARIGCPPRAQPTWLNDKAGPEFYIRAASSTEPLPADKWSQYIKERWAS
jgi:Protein kinase domain/Putative DNA-binding domain